MEGAKKGDGRDEKKKKMEGERNSVNATLPLQHLLPISLNLFSRSSRLRNKGLSLRLKVHILLLSHSDTTSHTKKIIREKKPTEKMKKRIEHVMPYQFLSVATSPFSANASNTLSSPSLPSLSFL